MTTRKSNHHDPVMTAVDWQLALGDGAWIPEVLAIARTAGKFHRGDLEVGASVGKGASLGSIVSNGHGPTAVDCPIDGVFLGWMAWEKESVDQGAMLARIGRLAGPPTNRRASTGRTNGNRKSLNGNGTRSNGTARPSGGS